jgi:hypothetical protein
MVEVGGSNPPGPTKQKEPAVRRVFFGGPGCAGNCFSTSRKAQN